MANYTATNGSTASAGTQQATATAYVGALLGITTLTTLRRGKIYDLLVGTNGTPADNYMTWDISRQTAAGTATSVTPNALNPADAAFLGLSTANSTIEPTVTANSSVFFVGVNQRASYRWVAAPGSEFVYPATTANGFALRVLSGSYTGTATGQLWVTEI